MSDDDLVEKMAIGMLEAVRGIGWWGEISEDDRKELRKYARAALAVAEPVIREWCAASVAHDWPTAAHAIRAGGTTP